jgi:WD40 repeat protein
MYSFDLLTTLVGHKEDRVWHISWSSGCKYLASCGEDKSIRIWQTNLDTLKSANPGEACIAVLEDGQSRTIRCVEWSPSNRKLASASFDGTVAIWERQEESYANWEMVTSLEGHESEVKAVSWSANENYLASCGRDKKVWIWEQLDEGEFECVAMLDGHTQDVKSVRWHPTELLLFSCSYDNTIRIWEEVGDEWISSASMEGHDSTVWGLCFNPDGTEMVSVGDDKKVVFWTNQTNSAHDEWTVNYSVHGAHRYPIYSVDWNEDGSHILSTGADDAIVLYYPQESSSIFHQDYCKEKAHMGDINCVRWGHGSKYSNIFASCGDDGTVKIWETLST